MLVDLVQATTNDGVRLDGVLHEAPRPPETELGVDAFVCLHGAGGNFYSTPPFDGLGPWLPTIGVAALRVNTRGHDGLSSAATNRGRRRFGAAHEIVDESRHDVLAWVEFLRGRGYQRVGLMGHSLGGLKAIYALANEPRPDVACLVAISPPRLSYSRFRDCKLAANFLQTLSEAEAAIADGKPHTLLEATFPIPLVISAAGYVDKYGPAERYNILRYLPRIGCPALVTFGALELLDAAAFQGLPEEINAMAADHALDTAVIPGANHLYTGTYAALEDRIANWLRARIQ
ncbi:MAG: alpha/beta fold hydrolase [Pirellulales bacterium]